MVVSLISRLSVLTVTRNRSRASRSKGCSRCSGTAPVCTFELGHSSSGIRLSRRIAASRPSRAVRTDLDVVDDAHTMAEPVGPQNARASWMEGRPKASPA
jgi:hypothetical protein